MQRRGAPQKPTMHFPLFQIPLFSEYFTVYQKMYVSWFSSAKISDDLPVVIDSEFVILPIFKKRYISSYISENLLFPPIFLMSHLSSYNLRVFASPSLTTMQLCIKQCTDWTSLMQHITHLCRIADTGENLDTPPTNQAADRRILSNLAKTPRRRPRNGTAVVNPTSNKWVNKSHTHIVGLRWWGNGRNRCTLFTCFFVSYGCLVDNVCFRYGISEKYFSSWSVGYFKSQMGYFKQVFDFWGHCLSFITGSTFPCCPSSLYYAYNRLYT